jgi:hypothetical protein
MVGVSRRKTMRTNADFIQQLREEISETQNRRESFIKAKLAFAVALLGVGAVSIKGEFGATPLLYLVPLVAFVFDLYILGEDFSIKRAGVFIKTSPAAPIEERLWEKGVDSKRDWFSYWAGPLSSGIILTAAAFGVKASGADNLPFYPWLIGSGLMVLMMVLYRPIRLRVMSSFEKALESETRGTDEQSANQADQHGSKRKTSKSAKIWTEA